MATESGYSNQKKYGESQYKTIHDVGSSKYAENVVTKGLVERQIVSIAITNVAVSDDGKRLILEIPSHGALRPGEVVRFFTGDLENAELDVIDIIDGDILEVWNVLEDIPQIGDEVRTAFYRTPSLDFSGNVVTNTGPTQFVLNGVDVEVEYDTVDPTNNKPLPAGMFIVKDGENLPVTDSITPADVVAVPVKIMAVDGTNINITAGDINIQTTDMGVNFDSMRIGDGSGNYIAVEADGSINVNGPLTDTQLRATPVPVSGPLTDTELRATPVPVSGPLTDVQLRATPVPVSAVSLPLPTGAATEATLSSIDGKTPALVGGRVPVDGSGVTQPISAVALPLPTGAATEATLAAMSAKLPATLGQKTGANSLAVVMASDYTPPSPSVPGALTVKNATVTAGLAAIRATTDNAAPSATRRKLRIFVDPDTLPSGSLVYLGASTVTAAGGTKGEQIYPGAPVVFDNDPNDYYIITTIAATPVSILEVE